MGVSGTSLSRLELWIMGGLRNELEPFWAWKCGAPERPLTRGAAERLKMRISGTAANPRRCRTAWKCKSPERPLTRGQLPNAWKCESPERPLNPRRMPNAWKCESQSGTAANPRRSAERLKMRISGTAASRGAAERAELRPWEAMNGLKLKKFWKWWSPERQNPPKNVKWWCSGSGFFGNSVKMICSGTEIHDWKWGSRFTYPIYIHNYGSTPPPPRDMVTSWWGRHPRQAMLIMAVSHPPTFFICFFKYTCVYQCLKIIHIIHIKMRMIYQQCN